MGVEEVGGLPVEEEVLMLLVGVEEVLLSHREEGVLEAEADHRLRSRSWWKLRTVFLWG